VRVVKEGRQGLRTTDYSDYRDVSGIKYPYKINDDQGQIDLDMTVKTVKVNAGLTDADFK